MEFKRPNREDTTVEKFFARHVFYDKGKYINVIGRMQELTER